ncbi:hypothetical protein [Alicyclobacillus acidoterrestris]|uniref:Uncharacterized protein n=1 Tax=Alicyclobacillus acidoterrestris (strain ATCC 49025 / DSM 3922 / CIP 106132 / NCIMB 13137 / GD3B) TaxID=1356854 RepID=T0CAN4_ALIAG|nr:hypothetical protein [Alicyclobacillus acidoterrestris]EPZ53183.1 hypothetical protein N007_00085 [Alicyclobacillus acidoterrestris ATCC 49025]UNO49246.1 hypothetical protein K1I37_01415 [Alicyclobacillus acidoterrestris]
MRPIIPSAHLVPLVCFLILLTCVVVFAVIWNLRRWRVRSAVTLLIAYGLFVLMTVLAAT